MSASPLEMFFSSATHYYICGRFAAFSALVPVAGNLFHHAVEMYLKGGLSKSKSLTDLKKLSHELPNVWAEFRAQFEEPLLQQFDDAISALHAFEDLRYPNLVLAQGMSSKVSITKPSDPVAGTGAPPQYDLCVEEIDKLVATLFTVVSVNPQFFTAGLKKGARQWLTETNAEDTLTSLKLTG